MLGSYKTILSSGVCWIIFLALGQVAWNQNQALLILSCCVCISWWQTTLEPQGELWMHLRTIAMLYKLILTLFYSQQRLELGARVGRHQGEMGSSEGWGQEKFSGWCQHFSSADFKPGALIIWWELYLLDKLWQMLGASKPMPRQATV